MGRFHLAMCALLLCATADSMAAASSKVFLQTGTIVPADQGQSQLKEFGSLVRRSKDVAVVWNVRQSPSSTTSSAAYVFRRVNGTWFQEAKLEPGFSLSSAIELDHVAISNDTVLIGHGEADVLGHVRQGRVHVYKKANGIWQPAGTITAVDGAPEDRFGWTVSMSGSIAVIGALNGGAAYIYDFSTGVPLLQAKLIVANCCFMSDIDGNLVVLAASGSGGVHTFERVGEEWIPRGPLLPNGSPPAVSISALAVQDDRVFVGEYTEGGDGATYVFARSGPAFAQEARLSPVTPGANRHFGSSIDAFGDLVVIGAEFDETGRAYVFQRDATIWRQIRKLQGTGLSGAAQFGKSLAIDGANLLVGAQSTGGPGLVFDFTDLPLPDGTLLGSSLRSAGGTADDGAGEAIAFSDGLLVVGAPNGDDGGSATGEAYVFSFAPQVPAASVAKRVSRSGLNGALVSKDVTLLATLRLNTGSIGDKFGSSVAVSGDGGTIAIGVPASNGGAGSVAVFREPKGGWESTAIADDIIPAPLSTADLTPGGFGSAISIADSGAIAVGAPLSDRPGAADAGMAATYIPAASDYPAAPTQILLAPAAQAGAGFGDEIDLIDELLTVGAPNQDKPGPLPDAGAVYTFQKPKGSQMFAPTEVLLSPGGGTVGDKFGRGIAIRPAVTGSPTVVVGATGIDSGSDQDTGSGYVFEDPGPGFTLVSQLITGGKPFDRAGSSIEIVDDMVLLGAPEADREGEADSGSVFLYRRPSGGWLAASAEAARKQGKRGFAVLATPPQVELPPVQVQADQFFGAALALSSAAAYVSAPSRDVQLSNGAVNPDQGEIDVFLFDRVFAEGFED